MTKPHLKIAVVSDVVCPWCYIGKRRLEKAVVQLKDTHTFEINYLPFQLSPDTPLEGENTKVRLVEKFGGEERYTQILRKVSDVAAGEGLRFNLENQEISPNTYHLHRLVGFAQRHGKQLEMVEALFKAYFEEAINLANKVEVMALAEKIGLNIHEVAAFLDSDEGKDELEAQLYQNRLMGISGVPYYIINDRYAISGAQPTEVFLEALPDIALKAPIEGQTCDTTTGLC
ncbi:MAG: DsbA family oxidoreductase [Runella sp.]